MASGRPAIYLGRHDGGFLVALQDIFLPDLIGYEQVAAIVELTAH